MYNIIQVWIFQEKAGAPPGACGRPPNPQAGARRGGGALLPGRAFVHAKFESGARRDCRRPGKRDMGRHEKASPPLGTVSPGESRARPPLARPKPPWRDAAGSRRRMPRTVLSRGDMRQGRCGSQSRGGGPRTDWRGGGKSAFRPCRPRPQDEAPGPDAGVGAGCTACPTPAGACGRVR